MKEREKRLPTTGEAIIFMIIIIAVIVVAIRMGLGGGGAANALIALFIAGVLATIIAFYLGNKWSDIQEAMMSTVKESLIAIFILIVVGMMIGVWMIGGTVPALVFYGLKLISPYVMLPLTFILCAFTSVFTGTSFGTISTMGIALVGVSHGMGMPVHVVAGAVVSGAYFGDKMSPLSDSTNMAAGLTGTPLYSHISSMFYSTIPATAVCILLYTFLGLRYASGDLDPSNIITMSNALEANFNLSVLTLIPPALVIAVSAKRVPALPGLTLCLIVSILLAMVLQNQSFVTVMAPSFRGPSPDTGVRIVDSLLSRGGIRGVQDTIILIIIACMMGGALHTAGILNVFVNALLKVLRKPSSLIVGTMLYSYIVLLLSGNQVLGIILGSRTFKDGYKDMDLHSRVLSRTLEDTNTIMAPVVPWSTAALFTMGILGVTTEYIPYVLFAFTVPIFSLICAFSGWGMFRADGSPMWKKRS